MADSTGRTFSLDVIKIKTPCTENWETMAGHGKTRYCDRCELHVHNLSAMSIDEVQELVAGASGRLCVRMDAPTVAEIAPSRRIARWRRVAMAAGLMVAGMLGLTAPGCDQKVMGEVPAPPPPPSPPGRSAGIMGDMVCPPTPRPAKQPTTQPVASTQPTKTSTPVAYPGEMDLDRAKAALPPK